MDENHQHIETVLEDKRKKKHHLLQRNSIWYFRMVINGKDRWKTTRTRDFDKAVKVREHYLKEAEKLAIEADKRKFRFFFNTSAGGITMSLNETFDAIKLAKFKFEFMALMMSCGREKEAAKSYEEGLEYLSKVLENLDCKPD